MFGDLVHRRSRHRLGTKNKSTQFQTATVVAMPYARIFEFWNQALIVKHIQHTDIDSSDMLWPPWLD